MRDRMERLVILPFSAACVSQSSVAVALPRRSTSSSPSTARNNNINNNTNQPYSADQTDEPLDLHTFAPHQLPGMKYLLKSLPIPDKLDISSGIHRLFKTISHIFAYKEDMEEVEGDMEIGFPTDVKHVTHIGLYGSSSSASSSSSTNHNNPAGCNIMGWNNLLPPELRPLHVPLELSTEAPHASSSSLVKGSST